MSVLGGLMLGATLAVGAVTGIILFGMIVVFVMRVIDWSIKTVRGEK